MSEHHILSHPNRTPFFSKAESLLAADFQFVAPIVGPLTREEFIHAFGSFRVKDAFPDLQQNMWFTVDPLEPNRVWFFSRAKGRHTGTLNFARPIGATNKEVRSPPEASSMLFNEQGKVYTLTVRSAKYIACGIASGFCFSISLSFSISLWLCCLDIEPLTCSRFLSLSLPNNLLTLSCRA